MYRKKRSVGLSIFFCLITCGIYTLYWIYQINEDARALNNDASMTSGGTVILLGIITCGIYNIFWMYRMSEKLDIALFDRNLMTKNNALLLVILHIFTLGLVSLAILQSTVNELLDYEQGYY